MTNRDSNAIAILGGTGDQGLGLALRFAAAGRPVRIGSRKEDRALAAAEEVRAKVPGADVTGHENADATRRAEIVILSVPFEHTAGTIKGLGDALQPGHVVVSMGVPLATAIGDGPVRMVGVWQGSCAELVDSLEPDGVATVNGGPLANARYVEGWTALLIGLNVRYKVPEGMGFRLTGLPE